MTVNRQHHHDLIDVVDTTEFDIVYHLLAKFIPEDVPAPDEIEGIDEGRKSVMRGEFVRHEDIDWN